MLRTFQRAIAGLAVACLLAGSAAANPIIPGKPQEQPIALVGGTVHPVDGPVVAGGIVLFDKGKIVAVGKDVQVPANAEHVDVTGKHVYPGLIDPNTSIGLTEVGAAAATIDTSEVGDANPSAKAIVAVNAESAVIPVTRANGVLTALTAPSGGTIAGLSAVINMDGWTWEDMAVEQVAGMHITWPRSRSGGGRFGRRFGRSSSSGDSGGPIKRIRETFATARAYMQAREADEATHFDAKWEGMIPVLKGKLPVFIAANSESEISNAVAFADQENINCVIVGGSQADKCTELLKRNRVPVILSKVHRLPRSQDAAYDDAFTLPKRLQDAGVKFAISSGEGAANVRNLPFNAGTAAAFGLSPEDALKSITLSAAEILGVGERLGSLTAGKDANVVIANGDILEVTTNVEMAFIEGSMVDLQSKHTLLYDKYMEKYRQMGVLNEPQQ